MIENKNKKIVIILLLLLSGLSGFLLSVYQHRITSSKEIQTIQVAHYPATFVKQLKGDPNAGEKIFTEFCAACHSSHPFIDVHAPRINDKKTWKVRRQIGIDALMKITIGGAGAMPARGGCFECSDAQLRETIEYMSKP